jgi:hypothetical protein
LQQLSAVCDESKATDSAMAINALSPAIQRILQASFASGVDKDGKASIKSDKSFSALVAKAGDFTASLLPLAILSCQLGGALGDSAPMASPLKAAANGAVLILQLVQKEKDRRDEIVIEFDRVSFQSRRVSMIQALPSEQVDPLLIEKSLDLMSEIINFLSATLKYLKHGFFANLVNSMIFGLQEWQDSLKALHLACEEFDQALILQIARGVGKIQSSSTMLNETLESMTMGPNNREFIKWLQPTRENRAQLLSLREQRSEGTLQWVLELDVFTKWRLGNLSSSFPAQTLWMTGLPGVGKSTISAFLHDVLKLQYPDSICLYFYCRSGTAGLTTAHQMVRSLCHQLTQQESFYQRYLKQMLELPLGGGTENLLLLFETLLKEPLSKGPDSGPVFVILDGLDELDDTNSETNQAKYSSRTDLEVALGQLLLIGSLRILATSRSTAETKRVF